MFSPREVGIFGEAFLLPPGISSVHQANREKMPALVCLHFPRFLRMALWSERSEGKGLISPFHILPRETPLVTEGRQDPTRDPLTVKPHCIQPRARAPKDSAPHLAGLWEVAAWRGGLLDVYSCVCGILGCTLQEAEFLPLINLS